MKYYRIHWKAVKTGATGHGMAPFTLKEAEAIAIQLNEDNKGITEHWIEPVEEEER